MNENEAKRLVERFAEKQRGGHFPCPRCGEWRMDADPVRNALSRRANVQVCDSCGMAEALEDYFGERIDLIEWNIVMHPDAYRMA